jgi:hypothetical protein
MADFGYAGIWMAMIIGYLTLAVTYLYLVESADW